MKRRDFVSAGASLLAASAVPGAAMALCGESGRKDLKSRYTANLGSVFQITDSVGGSSLLRLVAVDSGTDCPRTEQFSLQWEGDVAAAPSTGCYLVSHPEFGDQELYLEALAGASGRVRMLAHFSLLS